MSRWHREHPDYEETGEQPPDYWEIADRLRDRQKLEDGSPCVVCGEYLTPSGRPCRRCQASMEEDRLERESGR